MLSIVKIYCSGIGGIGLSAYASHMKISGHEVYGSDKSDSPIIRSLLELGIDVSLVQDGKSIPPGTDIFVFSEALSENSPERIEAKRRGIRPLSYFQALGEMTEGKFLIAVCGTHGKSSTTAMAAKVLIDSGKDPNVVVGTKMNELNGRNWRKGESDIWVVEACEYRRSFHYLSPKIVLLTNADGDHFDYFRDQRDYEQAFVDFLKKLPSEGFVVFHGNDPLTSSISKRSKKMLMDADQEITPEVGTPGRHMRQNAQLVVALSKRMGLKGDLTLNSLREFKGTWRRIEIKGITDNGIVVVDDYAHHPVEIRATLSALREKYPDRRIVTVFQPHTHDRTLKLWDEFGKCFIDSSVVIIPNIYDARPDKDSKKVEPEAFVKNIQSGSGVLCFDGKSLQATEEMLKKGFLVRGDILVTMGAGNVTDLSAKFFD